MLTNLKKSPTKKGYLDCHVEIPMNVPGIPEHGPVGKPNASIVQSETTEESLPESEIGRRRESSRDCSTQSRVVSIV